MGMVMVTIRNNTRVHAGVRVHRAVAEEMCRRFPQLYIVEDMPAVAAGRAA